VRQLGGGVGSAAGASASALPDFKGFVGTDGTGAMGITNFGFAATGGVGVIFVFAIFRVRGFAGGRATFTAAAGRIGLRGRCRGCGADLFFARFDGFALRFLRAFGCLRFFPRARFSSFFSHLALACSSASSDLSA